MAQFGVRLFILYNEGGRGNESATKLGGKGGG